MNFFMEIEVLKVYARGTHLCLHRKAVSPKLLLLLLLYICLCQLFVKRLTVLLLNGVIDHKLPAQTCDAISLILSMGIFYLEFFFCSIWLHAKPQIKYYIKGAVREIFGILRFKIPTYSDLLS